MGKEPGGTQKNAKGPREGEGKAGCRQGKWKGRGVGAERTRDTCTRKKSKSPGGNRTGLHSSSATDRPGFLAGNRIQLSGVGSSPSDRGEDGGDGGNAVATPLHRPSDFATWWCTRDRASSNVNELVNELNERIYYWRDVARSSLQRDHADCPLLIIKCDSHRCK